MEEQSSSSMEASPRHLVPKSEHKEPHQSDRERMKGRLSLAEQSVSQKINTLGRQQLSKITDNKSVVTLASGFSVSIRMGTGQNMAAKTDFQKVFQDTIALNNQKVSLFPLLSLLVCITENQREKRV